MKEVSKTALESQLDWYTNGEMIFLFDLYVELNKRINSSQDILITFYRLAQFCWFVCNIGLFQYERITTRAYGLR